jgi:hypothetical protein
MRNWNDVIVFDLPDVLMLHSFDDLLDDLMRDRDTKRSQESPCIICALKVTWYFLPFFACTYVTVDEASSYKSF